MSAPGENPPSYPPHPPQEPRRVLPVEDGETPPPFATPVPAQQVPAPPRGYYPPPIATIAVPQPIPAMPVPPPDFSGTVPPSAMPRDPRPGVVTAIGVGAVAAGCIGVLTAVAIAIGAFAFMAAANAAGRTVAATAASKAVAAPPPLPFTAEDGPNGMQQPDRARVIDALKYLEFISPVREQQLDALLAQAGAKMFPPDRVDRQRQSITDFVTEHNELFSGTPGKPGPIYFATPTGRFEVHDERAFFQPSDKSIGTIRTFAGGGPGTQALSIVQAGDIIAQAQAACGNVLSPAQQQTLRVMLMQPQQNLVPVQHAKSAVKSALVTPAGVRLQFNGGGALALGPMGQVLPTGEIDPPRVSRGAFATIEILAAVLVGLAIWLLVASAMVLRKSRRAPRVIKGYAWAKLVVTIALWAAAWWMIEDYVGRAVATAGGTNVATLPPAAAGAAAVQNWLVLLAVAGCAVPVALLMAVKTRAAREHFAGRRELY